METPQFSLGDVYARRRGVLFQHRAQTVDLARERTPGCTVRRTGHTARNSDLLALDLFHLPGTPTTRHNRAPLGQSGKLFRFPIEAYWESVH